MLDIESNNTEFSVAIVDNITLENGAKHAAELQSCLAHSAVVCLRLNRKLEKEEFEQVAEFFGPTKDPIGRTKDGTMFQYSKKRQVIDAGYVLTEEDRKNGAFNFGGLDDQRPGLFETYHCDDTYTECPALATVLHARALPPSGGGPTHFIDMRAAYEQLDADTKARLAGLQVLYAYNNEGAFPTRQSASGAADALIDVTHPLVRTHHIAGSKALFIDLDRAKHVVDMPTSEGRKLLQNLQDYAEANAPTCHHDWQDYDVLIWDNASVQHKAAGNFKLGEPRRFWRHMIAGPRPS
ncbi:MAG: TauD/TfdA family dioxygenase [Pseudomonadota bacterium]